VLPRKQFYLACFLCHLVLVFTIGCRDIVAFVARGYTWLPTHAGVVAQRIEITAASAFAGMPASHPASQAAFTYTHLGGIEAGYAFFAPSVPDNYKLVFELHYPDGRVEYDLPHAATASGGLRLSTLIDNIGQAENEELREIMAKMLAYAVWQQHPDATMIRTVLGFAVLPTAEEYRRGTRESDQFLYAYDFNFSSPHDGKLP